MTSHAIHSRPTFINEGEWRNCDRGSLRISKNQVQISRRVVARTTLERSQMVRYRQIRPSRVMPRKLGFSTMDPRRTYPLQDLGTEEPRLMLGICTVQSLGTAKHIDHSTEMTASFSRHPLRNTSRVIKHARVISRWTTLTCAKKSWTVL